MKILISNQEYLATVGITRHHAMQHQPFNTHNLLSSLEFCLCAISFGAFLIFEANNFREYIESIYFTSAFVAIAATFLSFIWNIESFFHFIDHWEKYAEKR